MAGPNGEVESKLDPGQSHFITIVGRKGSGKSRLAHRLFASYPYDRLVVDPHADTRSAGGGYHVEAEELTTPLPPRLLAADPDKPTTWRFVPDPGSPTYRDDLDRAVGLAFAHRRTCCWVDEMGDVAPVNQTGPNVRRALRQGRHRQLTLIMCEIRPKNVDPLVVGQADYVYVFDLPQPMDRQRVAENIGWPAKELDTLVGGLPRHGYLRYDARAHELVEFPPLPLRRHAPT